MKISFSTYSLFVFLGIIAERWLFVGSSTFSRTSSITVDDLWAKEQITLSLLPEVNQTAETYRLVSNLPTIDGDLHLIFKLKGSEEFPLENLFYSWTTEKEVGISWEVDELYHEIKVDGNDPDHAVVLGGNLLTSLQDSEITPICGYQKLVAPATFAVDGTGYDGSMTIGLKETSNGRRLSAATDACEMGGIPFVWDTCAHTNCGYIQNANPKISSTCTLGGVTGGVTATGTVIGGIGGAEVGVIMTTTQTCWNQFSGTCKFVSAFFGDYCTCHATVAPYLNCSQVSPCGGEAGGRCDNPKVACKAKTTNSTKPKEYQQHYQH